MVEPYPNGCKRRLNRAGSIEAACTNGPARNTWDPGGWWDSS